MAQVVSRWPLTAEALVRARVGFVMGKVALGQVFLRVLRFSPANIIPPLLHIYLSPPHEVCDSSDQAPHYHHLGPKLGASFLTRHFVWKQNKKIKKITVIFSHLKSQMFSNVHHKQSIVDNDMQHWQTLLMEQRNTQFQFHASGLAVHVVLRCKQHSLQHPTGKSLMVLGRVILVDTPHFPIALIIFQ
jgi:hypothetical protein